MDKTVLTIAGSDPSGGAGIEADIKVITVHRQYAMSVITALTAQNTRGVFDILETPASFVSAQLDCVLSDIPPDAVKIGMTANRDIIHVIAKKLREYGTHNIVLDPLMVSTSGRRLLPRAAIATLCDELFPISTLITPNLPEAGVLTGRELKNAADYESAAEQLAVEYGCAVLIKGGHAESGADDVLYENGTVTWFHEERLNVRNTHGTGCTLSSAIASALADGLPLPDAVRRAKAYLTGALAAGLDLGQGNGPLAHFYRLSPNP